MNCSLAILTVASQVRLYSTSHRDIKPPTSFDTYRWDHKKDPTRATTNEKQMTHFYLVTGGLFPNDHNCHSPCIMNLLYFFFQHLNRIMGNWFVRN